ncbi:hypothetical protein NNX39_04345 [Arthrobacter sp. zg-Y826]|uniref:hypothetical protein n=1 Tax=Arthrobacter jinronghuae TaxID=2964609 RepID=UPI00210419D8|nr:hypothetical protein [Arthrobacter jinronghuae]MCQ1955735.1 hypothetical protein [Arthrobacter jinronghuae]
MMAREVFAELGLEVGIHPDHAVDSSGRKYGFWNIAATCNTEPRSVWRSLIAAHLQRLLTSFDAPDPFDTLPPAEIPNRTFARLYEESALPPLDGHPHRKFAPGVVEMLALDLPDTVAVFRHENARNFGGWEALRQKGIANLRELEVEQLETLNPPGGGSFNVLFGSSFYTASKAMLLPSLAAELTGKHVRQEFGWLMSVPNRHQVVWHVIEDSSVIGAVNGMAYFAAAGYSDAPGPVSPHVYWWNGTGYEQLTEVSDDGTVKIRVGPGFQTVLESVMKG